MTKKYISKNTEFHADFESVVKLLKNAPKKVISKTCLKNMRKSKNSAYFRHVFANTFFMHFFKLFKQIQNQREILRFLIPVNI
jgi:hypothetical protein